MSNLASEKIIRRELAAVEYIIYTFDSFLKENLTFIRVGRTAAEL